MTRTPRALGLDIHDHNAADAVAVHQFAQHCLKIGAPLSGPIFQQVQG